jgi:2,5-furandicarboxylate decarboxylase 1
MNHSTQDLRSFLAGVEQQQTVLQIGKPVDVRQQVPALCSATTDTIVFNALEGFDGWRLTDCLVRDRVHQAIALGCRSDQVVPHYAQLAGRGPGRTVLIDDAPVKAVIWRGDEASLHRLPVPVPSEGIEVPHLGLKPEDFQTPVISGSIAVTKDPETNVHNCFFTMAKVHDARRAHCYVFSPHTWQNIQAYAARGERAPIALVIGCHPLYELAATYTGPHPGYSELELAAGMLGETVPLVKCESVDLEVPAYAEVIIEGLIDPEVAEYLHTSAHTDTHCPIVSREPFIDVTAITMRGDPIYRHIQPTRFTDHHALCEFIMAPMLYAMLKGKGLNVHDVAVPAHSCLNCAVIQMTPRATAEAREALLNGMAMPFFPRLVVAVDQDINIYDANELLYALSIRVDPASDMIRIDNVRSFNLEPTAKLIPGLEEHLLRSGSRLGIDATKPPLSQPQARVQFERLRARGEGKFRLEDFL